MKKYLFFLICIPLLFSCGLSDSKTKTDSNTSIQKEKDELIALFTRDLKQNIQATNNKNWDVALDFTYPHLFKFVSREETINAMETMLDVFKDFQTKLTSNVRHTHPIIDFEGDKFTKFSFDRDLTFTFLNKDDLDFTVPNFIEEYGEDYVKVIRNTNSIIVSGESSMLAVLEANSSEWKYLEWNNNMDQFVSSDILDQLSK